MTLGSPSRLVYGAIRLALALLLLQPVLLNALNSQDITCDNGSGEYSSRFFTGTVVSVGPLHHGGFAERGCTAKLAWGQGDISVASDAAQIGIDVLGADLGWGGPVVAFQIDKTGNGVNRTYQIYSLIKPPHLLYTIEGAASYSAADTDLDGKVEIWADDAAAIDGFERVPLKSFGFPPTVVLRIQKKHLVDVSSEFTSQYDAQIADIRAQLEQRELMLFKSSDGVLASTIPTDELHRLTETKIKVLEIVWAYLYSGRDAAAWSALREMWPAVDFNRIQAKICDVRQRGILRGVDRAPVKSKHKREVHIYDATGSSSPLSQSALNPGGGPPDISENESSVVQPKSILLRRPPPDEVEDFRASDGVLELLVDAAGKVRSAKLLQGTSQRWIDASKGWHFIPAFWDGNPVACRFRLSVWDLK